MVEMPVIHSVENPKSHYRVTWVRRHGRGFRREPEETILLAENAAGLHEQMNRLPGRVIEWSMARLHTCSVCGKTAPWDENWQWFGSLKQIDDGKPVRKFCSSACRKPGARAAELESEAD